MGFFAWKMADPDGREIAAGKFEVVSPQEHAKREMAKATAVLQAKLNELNQKLNESQTESRRLNELWKEATFVCCWASTDRPRWPSRPARKKPWWGFSRAASACWGSGSRMSFHG